MMDQGYRAEKNGPVSITSKGLHRSSNSDAWTAAPDGNEGSS
jgi:hypothetical protein